ncbi:pentapeptide repeat-containing protein [Pseudoalteromonas sp. DY56-GL79]|uniref:pentapeptide repeat-containing protein n=1 Tax=Pseudoalteromonas sp. DY56-GL79 TaxID=2967131 RepID=UPI003529EA09
MADEKEPVTVLKGDDAILLWLEGRNAWNNWMKEHPKVNIDFEGVDFSYEALNKRFPVNKNLKKLIQDCKDDEIINFSGYKFSGYANFTETIFSGYMTFMNAVFHDVAGFRNATFSGVADFQGATFSDDAYFDGATFSGDARFEEAKFNSDAYFKRVTFNKRTRFNGVIFSGDAHFGQATFNGRALFQSVKFIGLASFDKAVFGAGADFLDSKFDGFSSFFKISHGKFFRFASVDFNSKSRFEPEHADSIESLSFKGTSFERPFSLKGDFNCIPDLRQTKTSHHIDLSGVTVNLKRDSQNGAILEKAHDTQDAERLCRLKEIAESNKNHERALAFHADEMRAKRWIKLNWQRSVLDTLYSLTSNYGQSILRPFVCLMLSIFMFAQLTISFAEPDSEPRFKDALTVSIATVIPFISLSKGARDRGLEKMFGDDIPKDYDLLSYGHAFASFTFIFLIGLGLRNRFRI